MKLCQPSLKLMFYEVFRNLAYINMDELLWFGKEYQN